MAGAPFCVFIIACGIKASQRCQFQILDNNKTVTKPFDEILVTVFLGVLFEASAPLCIFIIACRI